MISIAQDIRFALRWMLRNAGVSALVIVCLGFGIAIATCAYAVVYGVLLRPLPFPDQNRLTVVRQYKTDLGSEQQDMSVLDYFDLVEQSQTFEELAASSIAKPTITSHGEPEEIVSASVSANFFTIIGATMALGREFHPEENLIGQQNVVILTDAFWRRHLGARPDVIGETLAFGDAAKTIVGVLPREFSSPLPPTDIFSPFALVGNPYVKRGQHQIFVIGKIKEGVSLREAQAEADVIASRTAQEFPKTNKGWRFSVVPLREHLVGDLKLKVLVLLGAAGAALFVACLNVAGLLLAMFSARQKDMALRAALGATPTRLSRQLLSEALVLGLLGGAVGIALSYWGLSLLLGVIPPDFPLVGIVALDGQVLGFAVVLTLAVSLLSGVLPLVQVSAGNLVKTLHAGETRSTASAGARRTGEALVVTQVALAFVLAVAAGLFFGSFIKMIRTDLGFDPENIVTVDVNTPMFDTGWRRHVQFFTDLMPHIRNLPGIESAGAIQGLPFFPLDDSNNWGFKIENRPAAPPPGLRAAHKRVRPAYFQTMGISLLEGRYFTEADNMRDFNPENPENPPRVLIVNESMAKRYWPSESPVGQRIHCWGSCEIVGVVGDVRNEGWREEAKPTMYGPQAQRPWPYMTLVIKTSSDPNAIVAAVRREVAKIDKSQAISSVHLMQDVVDESMASERMLAVVSGVFAIFAVLLATLGVYGMMIRMVVQRLPEMGVRMAVGAEKSDVLKLVLRNGLLLVAIGIGIGVLLSLALMRLVAAALYGVDPFDAPTFIIVAAMLAASGLLACCWPAWRAAQVDPGTVLNAE